MPRYSWDALAGRPTVAGCALPGTAKKRTLEIKA